MEKELKSNKIPGTRREWFFKGCRDGIPICLGYFAVSFALGITGKELGMSALQAFFMSLGMVASAGEFAALTLISASAGVIEMVTTTIVVNLRYLLMSCSLSQKLSPKMPLFHRFFLAQFITDELYGLSVLVPGYLEPFYTYGAGIVAVSGWCGGTVTGLLVGSILPDPVVNALSVALYGMFLAIIIPPAKTDRFILILIVVSMALSAFFAWMPVLSGISAGFRVIILTLAIAAAAAYFHPADLEEADSEGGQS